MTAGELPAIYVYNRSYAASGQRASAATDTAVLAARPSFACVNPNAP